MLSGFLRSAPNLRWFRINLIASEAGVAAKVLPSKRRKTQRRRFPVRLRIRPQNRKERR
jgi:hypothetical protein